MKAADQYVEKEYEQGYGIRNKTKLRDGFPSRSFFVD